MPPDPVRDLLENLVATGMTVRVVDRLESIDVAEQDGDAAAQSGTAGERFGDAHLELVPVRQSGQWIVLGPMGQRCDVPDVGPCGLAAVLGRKLPITCRGVTAILLLLAHLWASRARLGGQALERFVEPVRDRVPMGANVVTIRGRDVPGVRLTLTVLGLHPERIGWDPRITVGRDPVSLGHLAVEGRQLPQPRGVLPVLGMALPIHMVDQVIGLIDPRGLDIPHVCGVVTPVSHPVAGVSGCVPSLGILASGIADRIARVRAHRASIFAGYRADMVMGDGRPQGTADVRRSGSITLKPCRHQRCAPKVTRIDLRPAGSVMDSGAGCPPGASLKKQG